MTSNQKISFLGVAVAAALGMSVSQQAAAAVYATETPTAVLQNHVFKPTSLGKVFPLSTNYTVGGVNFMYASVVLGGGAKFNGVTNVKLLCMKQGVPNATAVGSPQSANSTSIFYAINTGITLIGNANSASSYCRITAPDGFKLGGTSDTKTMLFQTWRKVATVTAKTTASLNFITFARGVKVSATSGVVNDAVIDVATGSQKLKGAIGFVGATNTTAFVGTISYNDVSSNINTLSAAGTPEFAINAQKIQGTSTTYYRVTVSGAPLGGATKVSLRRGINGCSAGAGAVVVALGPSGQVFASNGVTGGVLSAGLSVCVTYSGTTSISAGPISASVGRVSTETSPWNYNFSTTNNQLHELKKNGKSFKLYNMNLPEALGGSTVEVSNIRLYNTSAKGGAVRATVFGSDGAQLGTAGTVVLDATTFAAKTAHVVSMTQLMSTLGITAYTGAQRPWVLLEGEVPSMDVQVVTRNKTTGVVVNMSPVTRVE